MITKVYDSITKASTREMEEEIRQQKLKEYNQSKLFIKFQDNYILDLIQTMYFKRKFSSIFGNLMINSEIYHHLLRNIFTIQKL